MPTVDEQFNIVYEKLQVLLRQHNRLQKENERLKEDLAQARSREEAARQLIEALEQQVTILKFSSGDLDDRARKDFEKKINQYIREIDRCIAYLSQ